MDNSKVFAAIDIGTTKVLTVIGRKAHDGRIEVLGHGVAPCAGVRKGVVEDVHATQTAVRSSVSRAESASGAHVDTAFVGITGVGISYEKRLDTIDWVGEHGVITYDEVEKVPTSVVRGGGNGYHFGRRVIHAIPRAYSIDGKIGVSDPMGMHTSRVDVETHLVQASEMEIGRLSSAVEGAGIRIEALVLEALASCESVLMQEEKVRGAALIDMGGGTTDVMVFKHGTMQYSSVIPVGGYQFTNDICMVYNTTYEAAEEVKLTRVGVLPDSAKIHEEVILPTSGGHTSLKVSLHDICQLTRERAQELIRLIVLKLREGGLDDLTDYRIVLSGGASKLDGFYDLFKAGTSADVRMGAPLGYLGVPRELQTPMCSTGAGILIWAAQQEDDAPKPHAIGHHKRSRRQQRKEEYAVIGNGGGNGRGNGNGSSHRNGRGSESERRSGILSLFKR